LQEFTAVSGSGYILIKQHQRPILLTTFTRNNMVALTIILLGTMRLIFFAFVAMWFVVIPATRKQRRHMSSKHVEKTYE